MTTAMDRPGHSEVRMYGRAGYVEVPRFNAEIYSRHGFERTLE
jgi:hypothetical protein